MLKLPNFWKVFSRLKISGAHTMRVVGNKFAGYPQKRPKMMVVGEIFTDYRYSGQSRRVFCMAGMRRSGKRTGWIQYSLTARM